MGRTRNPDEICVGNHPLPRLSADPLSRLSPHRMGPLAAAQAICLVGAAICFGNANAMAGRGGGTGGRGGGTMCNGDTVTDLAGLRSPVSGDTSTDGDNYQMSCGGSGTEAMFMLSLQPGESIDIGMDSNNYDSRHETSWGGDCPGTNVVTCTDDPDTARHQWTNDQGSAQTVFFVIDAYSSGSGSFTLSWTIAGDAGGAIGGDGGGTIGGGDAGAGNRGLACDDTC